MDSRHLELNMELAEIDIYIYIYSNVYDVFLILRNFTIRIWKFLHWAVYT